MLVSYGAAFCRLVIGLTFAFSFASKVRDIPLFVQTIQRFKLLPGWLNRAAALAFLCSEAIVVVAVLPHSILLSKVLEKRVVTGGFILAALMLIIFCAALASVLMRKIHTSCNCFGASEKQVSTYDIVRNLGFFLCALSGCGVQIGRQTGLAVLGVLDWGLACIAAAVFISLWVNIGEIVAIMR
jgi:hypothetical protein